MNNRDNILSMNVDCIEYPNALKLIKDWSKEPISRYVCISNVHMCMETYDSSSFKSIVNDCDLNLPDSSVIRKAQNLLTGCKLGPTKGGVDLVLDLCCIAEKESISIGFYGSTEEILLKMTSKILSIYPNLKITSVISPPFRGLTTEELSNDIDAISNSGTQILFVGLGCPKQEKWMAQNKKNLHCTMIGVGAAFSFLAGAIKPSPYWVHEYGLEWLYRLFVEPKRFWKRYFKHNPRFLYYIIKIILKKYWTD